LDAISYLTITYVEAPGANETREPNAQEVQIQAFRDAIERRDLDAVLVLLAEGVVFRPAVHTHV
jgi:ketosteroid isomerase-like protein